MGFPRGRAELMAIAAGTSVDERIPQSENYCYRRISGIELSCGELIIYFPGEKPTHLTGGHVAVCTHPVIPVLPRKEEPETDAGETTVPEQDTCTSRYSTTNRHTNH